MEGEVFKMRFRNGLTVIDNGHQLFFNKTDLKQIDLTSALSVVRCCANHLYRETGVKPDISTNRSGSNEMIKAFDDACKEARNNINQMWIKGQIKNDR